MVKLFTIQDFIKDAGAIVLMCIKDDHEFEIKFNAEKFETWLLDTDRLFTEMACFNGHDSLDTVETMISLDEYYAMPDSYIKTDLYEYVIMRLVTPHKLINGIEKLIK